MSTNLKQQFNSLVQEKEEFKKRLRKIEEKLSFLEKYLKHAEDIEAARKEVKEGKLYTLEEVEKKLGLK